MPSPDPARRRAGKPSSDSPPTPRTPRTPRAGRTAADRAPNASTPPPADPAGAAPVVTPPAAYDTARDPVLGADRLDALVHDLANLLDGSMRHVGLMLRSRQDALQHAKDNDDVARRLRTLQTALERMSGLVSAAGRAQRAPFDRLRAPEIDPMSLGDAVDHAMEMTQPAAAEQGIRLSKHVESAAGALAAGALYSVLLHALRNAVEAIASARRGRGVVEVVARVVAGAGAEPARMLALDIADDGPGLAPGTDPAAPFRPGFTTKPGGLGIGLAICRDAVRAAGGSVALEPRRDGTPGLVLRVRMPA